MKIIIIIRFILVLILLLLLLFLILIFLINMEVVQKKKVCRDLRSLLLKNVEGEIHAKNEGKEEDRAIFWQQTASDKFFLPPSSATGSHKASCFG